MRKTRPKKVYCYQEKYDASERQIHAKGIFIFLIIFRVVEKVRKSESDEDKKSIIDDNTIPYNTKCRNHEEEGIDSHKNDSVFDFFITFSVRKERMSRNYENQIQNKKEYIAICSIISVHPERPSTQIIGKWCPRFPYKIIEEC